MAPSPELLRSVAQADPNAQTMSETKASEVELSALERVMAATSRSGSRWENAERCLRRGHLNEQINWQDCIAKVARGQMRKNQSRFASASESVWRQRSLDAPATKLWVSRAAGLRAARVVLDGGRARLLPSWPPKVCRAILR